MEENVEKKSWLQKADAKFESMGKTYKFFWQLLKFFIVSWLATIIQLALVNLLFFCLQGWKPTLPDFLAAIFNADSVGEGNDNWGYVLPFLLSNAVANVFAYFLNKKKTFRSDAPLWHFVVYIGVLVILILVMTWFQGVIVSWMKNTDLYNFAPTLAAMIAGTIQAAVLFPLQKFVLSRERKKKEEMPSE